MSEPGRNAKGHFLNDDDTTVQAMDALAEAINSLQKAIRSSNSFSGTTLSLLDASNAQLERYGKIRAQIDVGKKPTSEYEEREDMDTWLDNAGAH